MNSHIYLIRHGKVQGNSALYGHTDALVEDELQARIASTYLNKQSALFDNNSSHAVYSSPLSRCRHLAERLAQANQSPCLLLDDLKEISFGDYDGVPFEQLPWDKLEAYWQHPSKHPLPGAETQLAFSERIQRGWEQLLTDPAKHLTVISHGGTIRMILALLFRAEGQSPLWDNGFWYSRLSIGNASVTHIEVMRDSEGKAVGFQIPTIGERLL